MCLTAIPDYFGISLYISLFSIHIIQSLIKYGYANITLKIPKTELDNPFLIWKPISVLYQYLLSVPVHI